MPHSSSVVCIYLPICLLSLLSVEQTSFLVFFFIIIVHLLGLRQVLMFICACDIHQIACNRNLLSRSHRSAKRTSKQTQCRHSVPLIPRMPQSPSPDLEPQSAIPTVTITIHNAKTAAAAEKNDAFGGGFFGS